MNSDLQTRIDDSTNSSLPKIISFNTTEKSQIENDANYGLSEVFNFNTTEVPDLVMNNVNSSLLKALSLVENSTYSVFNVSTTDIPNSTDLTLPKMIDVSTTEIPFLKEKYAKQIHDEKQQFYINIYTILIAGAVVLNTLRSILFFKIAMRASKGLHDTMFNNILQATMRFFDTNPSGERY